MLFLYILKGLHRYANFKLPDGLLSFPTIRIGRYPMEALRATHLLSILWNLKSCWALRLRASLYFNVYRAHVRGLNWSKKKHSEKSHRERWAWKSPRNVGYLFCKTISTRARNQTKSHIAWWSIPVRRIFFRQPIGSGQPFSALTLPMHSGSD